MDSNVSKNTNSHKFFKLRLNQETIGISVKNLLKQELLLILDLYQQNLNIPLNLEFISLVLERKISLYPSNRPWLLRQNPENHFSQLDFSQLDFVPIIYSCPVGLFLAPQLQMSPTTIVEQLAYLLTAKQANIDVEQELILDLEITSSGWLNFVLEPQFIITWLERSLFWINHDLLTPTVLTDLAQHSVNLFPIQYIHGRCCSLLHLGAREKLIILKVILEENLGQIGWHIEQPSAILWSGLSTSAEYAVLRQLLIVTDSWVRHADNHNWAKIALGLSLDTEIFLAECRFLGEIRQHNPQKAIARLGLIALVQYWLQRILLEKLKIAAPREL